MAVLEDISPSRMRSPKEIDRSFIYETCNDLSPEEFHAKWMTLFTKDGEDDAKGAMHLVRSFVGMYFRDLKNLAPAPLCPGYGDLHYQNFGHVYLQDGPAYVFNDFDDAGWCPVTHDSLRYFVILRMSGQEPTGNIRLVINEYCRVVFGGDPRRLPAKLEEEMFTDHKVMNKRNKSALKDWREREKSLLASEANAGLDDLNTDAKEAFVREEMIPIDIRTAIRKYFAEHERLAHFKVRGVAEYRGKISGGSAGHPRYWVLVSTESEQYPFKEDVIELKGVPNIPGTHAAGWAPPEGALTIKDEDHVEWCKRHFWNGKQGLLDFCVTIRDRRFHVRSRTKGSLKLIEKLKPHQRMEAYLVQAGMAAATHRPYWAKMGGLNKEVLALWMWEHSDVLATRYQKVFRECKAQMAPTTLSPANGDGSNGNSRQQ